MSGCCVAFLGEAVVGYAGKRYGDVKGFKVCERRRYGRREKAIHVQMSKQDEDMNEVDAMAEQWIGSNLGRWEWYERLKARRKKLEEREKRGEEAVDREMQELIRAFREIDAVMGTRFINETGKVTIVGWSIVVMIFVAYVALGCVAVELVFGGIIKAAVDWPTF